MEGVGNEQDPFHISTTQATGHVLSKPNRETTLTLLRNLLNLLSEELGDVLLAVVQVAAAVQRGIGHQQKPPLHFWTRH